MTHREPDELPPRYPLILATLASVLFTSSAQFLVVSPILPRIAEAMDVPEARLGALVTAYAVAVGACAFLAGPISDHFGRPRVLRWGTAWMAVALLMHGFATTFESLLVVRFLAGSASGMLGGAAMAYIGDVVPNRVRGTAMGVVSGGFAAGQVLGIPLGTLLAAQADYRAPFMVFGGLMVLASAASWFVLVETPRSTAAFRWSTAFEGYRSFLGRRDLVLIGLASMTMMVSVSGFITYEPLWIERTFEVRENGIAALFLAGGLANAVMGVFAGRLSDWMGRKGLVVFSSIGMGVGMLATAFAPSYAVIMGLFILTMALVGIRISPLNAWMSTLVDSDRRGSLMAMTLATGQVGFALGSYLAGPLFSATGFLGCAVLGCVGTWLTAAILLAIPEDRDGR